MCKIISSAKDLADIIGKDILDNKTEGETYLINNTIDCSLLDFMPLGSNSNYSFDGILDGQGNTIINLKINKPQVNILGLISKIGINGIVQNLRLEKIDFIQNFVHAEPQITSANIVGSIAGVCQGKISNCSASGNIILQDKSKDNKVGGICGELQYKTSSINDCWSNIMVEFKDNIPIGSDVINYKMGGIAGYTNGSIYDSHSCSSLCSDVDENAFFAIGGISGTTTSNSIIKNCYNIGYLSGYDNSCIGGIIGNQEKNTSPSVENCYYYKNCIFSKTSTEIGHRTEWADMISDAFAKKLGAKFAQTTKSGNDCTYTPHLISFDILKNDYINALTLPAPTIENPKVTIRNGLSLVTAAPQLKSTVSGFLPEYETPEIFDYNCFKYHPVGNFPPPPGHKYYANFSATVFGATQITVYDNEIGSTLIKKFNISPAKNCYSTEISNNFSPYNFKKVVFVVSNDAGQKASADWTSNKKVKLKNIKTQPNENEWKLPLKRLVWSLTKNCNLCCRHCSVYDTQASMTELTIEQIRHVVNDIIRLEVLEVYLSGGEILTSPYWEETARTLCKHGTNVSIITNGTLINSDIAQRIKNAGISHVSVSIDDFDTQENSIRGFDSLKNSIKGIKYLKETNIFISVSTTVNSLNLNLLERFRDMVTELGVDLWYLKPILPIGRAVRNRELLLAEQDINKIIEFCYAAIFTKGVPVVPALPFEMHTVKGAEVLKYIYGKNIHTNYIGSDAGIFSAQLNPDGNLVGSCASASKHSAGNVKHRSLLEIWRDTNSFQELRKFDSDKLEGFCKVCERRRVCNGGELNVRLAFGSIYAENKMCAYRNYKLYNIKI